jgi:hypothetical protein
VLASAGWFRFRTSMESASEMEAAPLIPAAELLTSVSMPITSAFAATTLNLHSSKLVPSVFPPAQVEPAEGVAVGSPVLGALGDVSCCGQVSERVIFSR